MKNIYFLLFFTLFQIYNSQSFTITEIENLLTLDYSKIDNKVQLKGFEYKNLNQHNEVNIYNYDSIKSDDIKCSYFESISKSIFNFMYIFPSQEKFLEFKKLLPQYDYEYMGSYDRSGKSYFSYFKYTGKDYFYTLELYNKFSGVYAILIKKVKSDN